MRVPNKAELLANDSRLRAEVDCLSLALADVIAGRVTWFRRGSTILGITRECGAAGGIVIERGQEAGGEFYFVGAYYWEAWYARVKALTFAAHDADGLAMREACGLVGAHVAKLQAEFYSKRTSGAEVAA